ncbi:hypothetical protein [Brevundimonas sp.]|jgi:hypothetical protein|uniref:hypothetical protein n=1 Tax=Brevundimonas sp. TaxID=1871086 RepID=UPI0037BE4A4C
MSFSATEAAFEGFRVVRRHPLTALFWGLAYLVVFLAMFGLGGSQWAAIMAAAETIEQSSDPSPDDLMVLMQAYAELFVWLVPLGLAVGAVLSAAVARSVLRPEESRWGYIRFGMDELRVLAVTVVIGLIVGLLSGVLFAVVSRLVGAGLASGQAVMFLLALIVALGAIALVIWLSVKFSLAVPMTLDRRKISVVESFSATKGQFWPLLGMAIIALVMSFIVSILGGIISAGTDLTTGGIAGLASMDGLSTLDVLAQGWPAILVWSVVNALLSALQLAVLYAPFSAAWMGLRNR